MILSIVPDRLCPSESAVTRMQQRLGEYQRNARGQRRRWLLAFWVLVAAAAVGVVTWLITLATHHTTPAVPVPAPSPGAPSPAALAVPSPPLLVVPSPGLTPSPPLLAIPSPIVAIVESPSMPLRTRAFDHCVSRVV